MQVLAETDNIAAVGPYSLAIEKNGMLFLSGQIGIDKEKNLVWGGVEAQFDKIMTNIKEILAEMDYEIKDIVHIKNYLADLKDFAKINELYRQHLEKPYPTRSTFQVAGLPLGASIEVEVVAVK